MKSLNPLDWLEALVKAGVEAFARYLETLIGHLLEKVPQRQRKPKSKPG